MDVCFYSLFVRSCVGSGRAIVWSPAQGALPTVYRIEKLKWNEAFLRCPRLQKEQHEIWMNEWMNEWHHEDVWDRGGIDSPFLILVLDEGKWWALPPGSKPPVPIVEQTAWAPEPLSALWSRGNISCPYRKSKAGRPARSPSLYRLSFNTRMRCVRGKACRKHRNTYQIAEEDLERKRPFGK
jgi:hypothetical protein